MTKQLGFPRVDFFDKQAQQMIQVDLFFVTLMVSRTYGRYFLNFTKKDGTSFEKHFLEN